MRSAGSIDYKLRSFGKSISLSPFIVAVFCALLLKLGITIIDAGFVVGFVFVVVGAWILANYFFEIIDHRAMGMLDWPVLSVETLFAAQRQLGMVFAALIVGVLGLRTAIGLIGFEGLARIFGAIAASVLPISAAMLAVTKSPLRAIDPVRLVVSAARMEMGYIVMLVASFAFLVLATRAASSGGLTMLLITSYGFLVLGFVIGSVVYGRRAALGVRTRRAPEDRMLAEQAARLRERRVALNHAYVFAGRGNVSGALAHIASYALTEPDSLAAEMWLFQEMTSWEDPFAAIAFGRELPDRLTAGGREREAKKVAAMRELLVKRLKQAKSRQPRGTVAQRGAGTGSQR